MYMKQHILAALSEEYNRWEELLAGLSEAQITTAHRPSSWSIKDDITHLWAWQQRSIARLDAARLNREPTFPKWPAAIDPDSEDATDQINAWIYESNQNQSWSQIHQNWSEGFRRFLAGAEAIAEKELLDSGRYPWLNAQPLAFVLIASYDHHHEHLEKVIAWLREQENGQIAG
jgi:hypothetical protein